jgi:predicted metal-binding membrane protein
VTAVAWAVLVRSEAAMTSMSGDGPLMAMMWAMMRPSDALPYFLAAAVMWMVMMVGMMTPAVVPMATVYRDMHRGPHRDRDTLCFAGGYLAGWCVFALVGALLQLGLHARGLVGGHLLATGPRGAGVLLVLAGLYQLTPWKEACLRHCRSPLGFFLQHWAPGPRGALAMGTRHGLYCVGCCWVLMLLMFAGGAMSVLTMAVLCAFILAERLLPPGPWVSRIPGVLLLAAGVALLAGWGAR